MTRNRIALLSVVLLLLIMAIFTRPLFQAVDAAALLIDLANGGRNGLVGPERKAVRIVIQNRQYNVDFYLAGDADPARAALVLVPGAAHGGKDDPRLVALAQALRGARFDVLVPDLVNLREMRVSPTDARAIADQVVWLAGERTEAAPIGVAAISYAVGPAVLASLDPRIRDRLDFVVGVGGYYDLESVIGFFTTGHYREPETGHWRQRTPNTYGKWLFVLSNLHHIGAETDRRILATLARRKMIDPTAKMDDFVGRLGPEGRAVYALIDNRVREKVADLIAALPATIRNDIAALSLHDKPLTDIGARLILIHGREDPIIPYSESVKLSAAAPPGQATLFLVDHIGHADIDPHGLSDNFELWRAAYRLIEARDIRVTTLFAILQPFGHRERSGGEHGRHSVMEGKP